MNIWQQLQQKTQKEGRPFFCIAPMADVTDVAFRELIAKYSRTGEDGGGPDMFWTEFVSANGLASIGRDVLQIDLQFTEQQRPIVAQLFTNNPEHMRFACALCAELGFDGIDINMGCPDKTIEKQGAGAAMIRTPEIAQAIIAAAKQGVEDAVIRSGSKRIPISVKTRVGYSVVEKDWITMLLNQDIAALSIHVRTRKELSLVPADWSRLKDIVKLRDSIAPQTVLIGNGDVTSLADGIAKARMSGVDGVMVGRALFGNPWFFDSKKSIHTVLPKRHLTFLRNIPILKKLSYTTRGAAQSDITPISIHERLSVMVEHAYLFEKYLGTTKSFSIMKKHFKAYCTGFRGAKELRMKLMDEAKNASDVRTIVAHSEFFGK